jgi:hypothetical protein
MWARAHFSVGGLPRPLNSYFGLAGMPGRALWVRPAPLAARGTALIRLEAVERRAHGNLVGISRPDDEFSYVFRRLPCFVGALPRGVGRHPSTRRRGGLLTRA